MSAVEPTQVAKRVLLHVSGTDRARLWSLLPEDPDSHRPSMLAAALPYAKPPLSASKLAEDHHIECPETRDQLTLRSQMTSGPRASLVTYQVAPPAATAVTKMTGSTSGEYLFRVKRVRISM